MASAFMRTAAKAATERLSGGRPGVMGAVVAAAVTGTATAVATYKLLRGAGGSDG